MYTTWSQLQKSTFRHYTAQGSILSNYRTFVFITQRVHMVRCVFIIVVKIFTAGVFRRQFQIDFQNESVWNSKTMTIEISLFECIAFSMALCHNATCRHINKFWPNFTMQIWRLWVQCGTDTTIHGLFWVYHNMAASFPNRVWKNQTRI